MSKEPLLILTHSGKQFEICWIDMGQSCDFFPVYVSLLNSDKKKVDAYLFRTANHGITFNPTKWKKEEKGIFAMKLGQIRIPYFYHSIYRKLIVISHMFIKKKDRWHPKEIKRVRDRKALSEKLVPQWYLKEGQKHG